MEFPGTGQPDTTLEKSITLCITELQKAFGAKIERIFGSGGGLLAVLNQVDENADLIAAQLSTALVPVAVIDHRTLNGLARLGAGSLIKTDTVYWDASEKPTVPQISRLTTMALEKLKAARVLIEQNLMIGALEILLSAQLAMAAGRAGLEQPIAPQEAGVWLYSEALPKGVLSQNETDLITKTISLSQCQTVPETLIKNLLIDTELFVQTEDDLKG